jgi:hypothetical protein
MSPSRPVKNWVAQRVVRAIKERHDNETHNNQEALLAAVADQTAKVSTQK